MWIISDTRDLRNWIVNANPNNVIETPERIDVLVEALRSAPGRPAWATDWEWWLDLVTCDDMPGTRANPMPGASHDEIENARRAWSTCDMQMQEERNDELRRAGCVVERDAAGHVTNRARPVAEHRATVDGRGSVAGLTSDEAIAQVRAWLTLVAEDSIGRGHGVPVGITGRIDRRIGAGAWVHWRTLRIRQEPGERTWSIVRADR